MTEIPDLGALAEPERALAEPPDPSDVPSMRAVVLCKEPTEAFELELIEMQGVIVGIRADGSELLYIPWHRVRYISVPQYISLSR